MTDKDNVKNDTENEKTDKDGENSEKSGSEKEECIEADDIMKEMEAKIEAAAQEAKDNHDRLLRVSADFENYKKRSAREMEGLRKFANESLIKEMLPVVDNLERAIDSSNNNGGAKNSIVEGVDMTLMEILKVLEKFGVKPIESLGETFDPSFHEAVMQQESEDHAENMVLQEFQKGYMINDRLLRPAMVVVSKSKAENEKNKNE